MVLLFAVSTSGSQTRLKHLFSRYPSSNPIYQLAIYSRVQSSVPKGPFPDLLYILLVFLCGLRVSLA